MRARGAGIALLAGAAVLALGSARIAADAQGSGGQDARGQGGYATAEALGEALFFDTDLSANRSQACASCHDPARAFTDPRETEGVGGAVSIGDDGHSLGTRNAPTAAYARFAPVFHRDGTGHWTGGQFLDGRAADLAEQAGGPPLNPAEMGMADKAAVVARLREKPDYLLSFEALYGPGVLADPEAGYAAMTRAIAAFEGTAEFAPFDSKYDRWLRGEYKMTPQEELGRVLFFSNQFTNCNLCHQLHRDDPTAAEETFTTYQYHNIGVPANPALAENPPDAGLRANPAAADDPAQAGRFKVPSLRNVAVTGPYMHNGVFKDLRTVILFYNKYNSKAARRQIDPETGQPWAAPEVAENLSLEELETGPALDDKRIDALVAFLATLTDARYEPLLAQ